MVDFRGFARDLGSKGRFGFLWLAATVGSSDRSLSKAKLLKIDLSRACDEIGRSAGAAPGLLPPAEELTTSEEEEEEKEEVPKRKRRVVKKKRRVGAAAEAEEGALGLRLSANLLLGVARVYELQSEAVQIFLSLRPGFMDEYFAPAGAAPSARGGKGRPSVAGLDMTETTVNIDAPLEEEAGDDLAFAFDFGGDAWEDLGYGSVPSWTTVQDQPSAGGMELEEGDVEIGRERARGMTPLGRPSSILSGLRSPGLLSIGDRRPSEPPYGLPAEPEYEPLDLGLDLGLEERPFDDVGRPSSVAGPEYDYGGGMDYQPDEGAAFADIPELPPAGLGEVPAPAPPQEPVAPAPEAGAPEAPAIPPGLELPARPRPILKPEGAIAGAGQRKRKKTVRLAVRDEALTYADEEIREWRATYVDRMLDQGQAQRQRFDERAVRQQADDMLLGMPDLLGFRDQDMTEFYLEQQNRRRAFEAAPPGVEAGEGAGPPGPPAPPAPASPTASEDARRRRAEGEFFARQGMGGAEEMRPEGMEYVEYEYPLAPEVSREDIEVELGRRASSVERRLSAAPWEVSSIGGREPSVGLEGIGAPPSVGRPSSVPESDILAGRRPRPRALSRASVERESVAGLEGMEGEGPVEGLIELERESLAPTATTASRAQQQFLDYLKTMLAGEPEPSPPPSPPAGQPPAPPRRKEVAFSTLVPTDTCTPIVAAKGFYQLLVLATRDAIAVRQPESFGELFVAIKEQPQAETTAHDEPQQSAYDDDQTESMDVDEP